MAKNKQPKRPYERVEMDDHWIDGLCRMFDELILDNARETLSPKVRRTPIEVYMDALRKQPQVTDNEREGEE